MTYRFFVLIGIREIECSGIFVEENAHRGGNTALHLQGAYLVVGAGIEL